MKVWRKLTAVLMAATIIFGSFAMTGCWKKNKKGEVVSEDDPWFTYEKTSISDPYKKKINNMDYFDANYIGKDGENSVFMVFAQSAIPSDYDWDKGDGSEFYSQEIAVYDPSGKLVNSIDTGSFLEKDSEYLNDYSMVDGKVRLTIIHYDMKKGKETHYETDVNLKDGKGSKRVEVKADASANEGSVVIGDVTIGKNYYYDEKDNSSYKLIISDKSKKTTTIDLGKEIKGKSIYNIDSIMKTDETNALIICSSEDGEMYLNLSLSDYSIKKLNSEDYKWLSDGIYNIKSLESGSYVVDALGVKKIDFDKKELTEVFSFNNCNLSRYELGNCQLLDISDNKITILQCVYNHSSFSSSSDEYSILTFTKADKNPNAGKGIIEILCLNGISKPVANAVCEFNDTNKDYFIKYSSGYDAFENLEWTDGMTDEEWEKKYIKSQADMSNKLAIDLMNGDGPDIVVGGFMYGQLNNDSYLVDLSSRMDKHGTSGYFSNVIDGSKVGGKLYQVPLSFYVEGIVTDSKNVEKKQKGFTFDQYAKFVDKVCNGNDPIYSSQIGYLTELADNMHDIFIDGNKANYDNDAFKALCKYVKDNVNENTDDENVLFEGESEEGYEIDPAQMGYIGGIEGYIGYLDMFEGAKELSVLGLPSYDGRGVTIQVSDSVGVSAQAVDEDACWAFVETLLGESSQKLYADAGSFCLNVKAYESSGETLIKNYNDMVSQGNYSYSGRGNGNRKLDKSLVTNIEKDIIGNGHVLISDPSINIIIAEEIPAYLSGQKKIGDVISIIENRANTVLGER